MVFNPLSVFTAISRSYEEYIKSTFYINDERFRAQFNSLIDQKEFTKGPIIECTDSFLSGDSIYELVHKKKLHPRFMKIFTNENELHRSLYEHQIDAIEKSSQDRNMVITTGTGSGKTECFLYPIFNALFNEIDNNTLSPGVRALLLYPMNALANDQIKRLRELLAGVPEITFGVYTGETEDTDEMACAKYQSLYGTNPMPNEIISRQAMKENMPHILLTNYAMLEYLLLRPNDNVFFDDKKAFHWKYIVLDEAHTYRGAAGIEISYLIRRLYHRLQQREKIRFILTSATLGDTDKNAQILDFAKNISAGLEYNADDIIRAKRKEWVSIETSNRGIDIDIYTRLLSYLDSLKDFEMIIPESVEKITGIPFTVGKTIHEYCYSIVIQNPLYSKIRKILQNKCSDLYTIAHDLNLDPVALSSFFTIAGIAQVDSLKLVDLRYHAFIRSIEGVYVTFYPEKTLSLTPRKKHQTQEGEFYCYKLSVCQFCGQIYIEGIMKGSKFKQPETHPDSIFQVLDDHDVLELDDLSEDDEKISKLYSLCTKCNTISEYCGVRGRISCDCEKDYSVVLLQVHHDESDAIFHKCAKCKNINTRGSILRGFYIGSNAVSSILAASIFESIPFKNVGTQGRLKPVMGYKSSENASYKTKRLLVFSDNRQEAAFFATYLQSTYSNLLKKRLLLKTARECALKYPDKGIPLFKLAHELSRNFELEKIIDVSDPTTIQDSEREAWKTLLYEIHTGDRNGLVNLGFLQFKYLSDFNSEYKPFSQPELVNIDELLMDSFLKEGALALPVKLTVADYREVLFQSNPAVFVKEKDKGSKNLGNVNAWMGKNNRRVKILRKTGKFLNDESIMDFLSKFWEFKTSPHLPKKILEHSGRGYQLLPELINVKVAGIHDFTVMQCCVCGRIALANFKNVCMEYRCAGTLIKMNGTDLKTYQKENFEKGALFSMVVREHTAQLSHKKAAEYQKEFITGKTHVLSCSTTFEMGVDVGDLETVFMRNMPPTPANYIQRAGRAWRRVVSTAFALTFCKLANHDFVFFKHPEKMIQGIISPPSFKLSNDKIVARHVYSALLSAFWRKIPEIKNIGDFFSDEVYLKYSNFIKNSSADVVSYVQKFTEGIYQIEKIIEIINDYSQDHGLLANTHLQYKHDIGNVEKMINQKHMNNEQNGYDKLASAKKTMLSQDIISFFSRNNLIPKYGFPVDTVELHANLRTIATQYNATSDLKLQRDMSIALSEYAPGSEVIANGMLYKSNYVKPAPDKNMTWRQYAYAVCDNQKCRNLNVFQYFEQDEHKSTAVCSKCKKLLNISNVFIIPDYGFIASNNIPERATTRAPIHTARARTHYVGSNEMYSGNIKSVLTKNGSISIIQKESDTFATINQQAYFVCHTCGYASLVHKQNVVFSDKIIEHKNTLGDSCSNKKLYKKSLGYTFKTDAVALTFNKSVSDSDYSILYMFLEGMSHCFDIERRDIDGTLHYGPNKNGDWVVYYVLYDTVPVGAGHTKRIMDCDDSTFMNFLKESYHVVAMCNCGDNGDGQCACYSCLCNYHNQLNHEKLNRKSAQLFLKPYVDPLYQ